MKKVVIYLTLLISFLACENNGNNSGSSEDNGQSNDEKLEKDKKVTKRDLSITPGNSYNNLFLDSADVARFITEKNLNDTLTRRIRSFYNARNYQYAWFASDGLTEQARQFWNLHQYFTTYSNNKSLTDKALQKKMQRLVTAEDLVISAADKSSVNTELLLTEHFIQYSLKNYDPGTIKRKELERFVPRKKEDAMYLADSLLTKKHKDNKYYEDANPSYKKLKDQLQDYYNIAKNGGWPFITTTVDKKKLKKGSASPVILNIKRRLQATGELAAADTTNVFDDNLEGAIKTFQLRHGYTPTGVITTALIKDMNVFVEQRIQQLLINMDRMRWMPQEPEGNLIVVNIPEFVLHVYEGKTKVRDMPVVVGKEGHNTMAFTGNLNQVVFSPYWNVTPDIVKEEVLPAMEKDPDYLIRNNMEQTGEEEGIPVIRQLPGPKNSLGQVKFLFPNDFNIYFHDTPAKSLFSSDKRAYSHGCIRLSDPVWLATYLLRDQKSWTPEKIDEAMNSGEEEFVRVKKPVSVYITYYTAWVDENGLLNFRDDIYSHDAKLASKMFVTPFSSSIGKN
ncbi:MAG: L,D-transpeptidase family protein [Segetibacter sp.]|nr:L,D-transpeptidase family protein [Segetibacter sp.]